MVFKAVAALWEHQETEIEAVHLAIALLYHGLLRVPSRAETSDMTPRKCAILSTLKLTPCYSIHITYLSTCA